jgi:hypothetical protein
VNGVQRRRPFAGRDVQIEVDEKPTCYPLLCHQQARVSGKKGKQVGKRKSTRSERWCLGVMGDQPKERGDACEHPATAGQYVVKSASEWCQFVPPTRLQATLWCEQEPERFNRVMWLCHICGEVQPLSVNAGV